MIETKKYRGVALVTGATSGIGFEITQVLLGLGYFVYGVGRDFEKSKELLNTEGFSALEFDLKERSKIESFFKKIGNIDILVNCAGVGIFSPFSETKIEKIDEIVSLNLTSAMILSRVFIKELIKNRGYIFNITSIEATRDSKNSAIYSATKSALRAFSKSLFEEVRKDGVKVVSINPDMTRTNFFDSLRFECSDDSECSIDPKEIAEFIGFCLDSKSIFTDVTLRPQRFGINKKGKMNEKKR